MKILVLNCGSSSLKYSLFDTARPASGARGLVEKIGEPGTRHAYDGPSGRIVQELPPGAHRDAFLAMVAQLTAADTGVLRCADDITAVGHRVVHGGDRFAGPTVINDEVLEGIEKVSVLAPLHNPVNLVGIREAQRLFPAAPHVAVFDTGFHQSLPPYAFLYGLPYECYEQDRIRRYGFHGLSHLYVSLKAAQHVKRPFNQMKTIVCHLGNGASVCAVDHGRSVDTSMGLTPTEGLIMGTRCGDLDPAAVLHLMRSRGLSPKDVEKLLNKEGGLKGLSGVSNDMREIMKAADGGNHRALLALKTFCYRIRKYIGAYYAAMGGLDSLVFTGGIGQGSSGVRALACQGLEALGIALDDQANRNARGVEQTCAISRPDSRVAVLVVPTDEERMIARETLRTLGRYTVVRQLKERPPMPVPLEVSAHHVHLAQADVEMLFGPGHALTFQHELSQPGQFACVETVNLVGPRGRVDRVRVLGPARPESQVEISMTEQFRLGLAPPIRASGDLNGTPGVTVEGPHGSVALPRGVICALRHIHAAPEDALRLGLRDRDRVMVRVTSARELIFGDVLVRVHPSFRLAMHIDTDEANAASIRTGVSVLIDRIQEV